MITDFSGFPDSLPKIKKYNNEKADEDEYNDPIYEHNNSVHATMDEMEATKQSSSIVASERNVLKERRYESRKEDTTVGALRNEYTGNKSEAETSDFDEGAKRTSTAIEHRIGDMLESNNASNRNETSEKELDIPTESIVAMLSVPTEYIETTLNDKKYLTTVAITADTVTATPTAITEEGEESAATDRADKASAESSCDLRTDDCLVSF